MAETRKPPKDPRRTAEFRETARQIVISDRERRRDGHNVDTGGAIARAIERAYARGYADAQQPHAPAPAEVSKGVSLEFEAMDWMLIPPRPRGSFEAMCSWMLSDAGKPQDQLPLRPVRQTNGGLGWVVAGAEEPGQGKVKVYGQGSVKVLLELGLLMAVGDYDRLVVAAKHDRHSLRPLPMFDVILAVSPRGVATWERQKREAGWFDSLRAQVEKSAARPPSAGDRG